MSRSSTSPASSGASFSYALIRVSPRVERGEVVNAGIVVHCPERGFLGARAVLNASRMRAISDEVDLTAVEQHLRALLAIAAGLPAGGPIAELSQSERFHWLSAPRSTIIQPSRVHTGVTDDPARTLDELFHRLVSAEHDIELAAAG